MILADQVNPIDRSKSITQSLIRWWHSSHRLSSWGSRIVRDLCGVENGLLTRVSGTDATDITWGCVNGNSRNNGLQWMRAPDNPNGGTAQIRLDATNSGIIGTNDNFTLSCTAILYNALPVNYSSFFVGRGKDGSGAGWSIQIGEGNSSFTGGVVLTSGGAASVAVSESNSGETGKEKHFVLRCIQGTGVAFWIDGRLAGTASSAKTSLRTSTVGMYAMGAVTTPSAFYRHPNGAVNDIMLWKRPLSDGECASLFGMWQREQYGELFNLYRIRRTFYFGTAAAPPATVRDMSQLHLGSISFSHRNILQRGRIGVNS